MAVKTDSILRLFSNEIVCTFFGHTVNICKEPNKMKVPLNCISHSRTLSICTAFKSERSSYSSLSASLSRQNVASPLEASLPANIPYGPAGKKKKLFRLSNPMLECLK